MNPLMLSNILYISFYIFYSASGSPKSCNAFSYGEIAWLSGAEHRWKLASEEMFLKLIRAHGADRIVFGTDSPWTDQKRAIKDIQALPLSDEDKKKILGENALQLLGLPDAE